MPFLNRRFVSLAVRREAEKKYRGELRAALANPGLSTEQKVLIRHKLNNVGKPKVYDATSLPPPGAIELSKSKFVESDLKKLRKAELLVLAREHNLSTDGTKAAITERLLNC